MALRAVFAVARGGAATVEAGDAETGSSESKALKIRTNTRTSSNAVVGPSVNDAVSEADTEEFSMPVTRRLEEPAFHR